MVDERCLDQQLHAANRVPVGMVGTDEGDALMDELGARILADTRRFEGRGRSRGRARFRGRGLMLASLIGSLVVGAAAAATVTIVTSTTVGTPGFCQTALREAQDIPFPSGDQAWKNWALLMSVGPKLGTTLNELCHSGAGARIADDGYPGTFVIPRPVEQTTFLLSAVCAWSDQWLAAKRSGDTPAVSRAAGEVASYPRWLSTADSQADWGYLRLQGWLSAAQRAIRAGDVAMVASMFTYLPRGGTAVQGECVEYAPPPGSDDGTAYRRPVI
jgi:hypothetical protein